MGKKIFCIGFILLLGTGCLTGERPVETPMPQQTMTITQAHPMTPLQTTKPPSITSPLLGNVYEGISVQELQEKIEKNEDFILLDVRTQEEFNEGYIPGVILIPFNEIDDRHEELNALMDGEIVVYCKAGVRSKKGAQKLTELGYNNVKELGAGIDGWLKIEGEIITPAPITTELPTTEPSWTTEPAATTTVPPSTTAPPKKYFWKEIPAAIYQLDEGESKTFEMNNKDTVRVGDTLIYFEDLEGGISGSCFPIAAFELSVFKATEEGGEFESSVAYTDPPNDITSDVHQQTDALDDYTIVVEEWRDEKITLTLTRQK